jgi:hypothetical protein
MPDDLPTRRSTLRSRCVWVLLVWCKSCRHRRDPDLQALVDAGRGDVPLVDLRIGCSNSSATQPCDQRGGAGPQAISPSAAAIA